MIFSRKFKPVPPPRKVIKRWFADEGDKTVRLDYPLQEDSIVFDLGGYLGDWAAQIFERYGCHVEVFEPVERYAASISKRFADESKISVHPFGLGRASETIELNMADDGTSAFLEGGEKVAIQIEAIKPFLDKQVALIKINIEGGEYDLLEHLLDAELVDRFDNLQIQFHGLVPDYKRRRRKIQKGLRKTHKLTYNYPLVWENWVRK